MWQDADFAGCTVCESLLALLRAEKNKVCTLLMACELVLAQGGVVQAAS